MNDTLNHWLAWIRVDLWGHDVLVWSGRALTALIMLAVGMWLARHFAELGRRALRARGADEVLATFLRNTAMVVLSVIVLVGAMDRAGVPIASLLAALGAAGLAIGLALKDSLGHLASGVLLIITRPFRAGDFVEVAGCAGIVERIDLLQTVLVTPDHRVISVPNSEVMGNPIINLTAKSERRIDLLLPLPPDVALVPTLELLQAKAEALEGVLKQPPVQVLAQRVSGGALEVSVRVWVATPMMLELSSRLLTTLQASLQEAKISLQTTRPTP